MPANLYRSRLKWREGNKIRLHKGLLPDAVRAKSGPKLAPLSVYGKGVSFFRGLTFVFVYVCVHRKHQVYTCNWFIPYLPSALILRLGLPDSPEFVIMPKLYLGLEKFWDFLTSGCRNWRKVNYGFM